VVQSEEVGLLEQVLSWGSSGLVVRIVIGLVARLATSEAGDGEASRCRSRNARRRTGVASSLLGVAGVPPSEEQAMSSTSEAAPKLVVPQAVAPPQHVALSAPRLLEGSVVVVPISGPLLALDALIVAPPLVIDRDGMVDEVAKGLVLACLQSLAKAVVKASQELELLLLVGVGVVGGIPHHLHEVVLILLDPHRTLSHGAELLHLLDQQLTGQVFLAECLAKLQPGDECWVRVGGGVVVPPSLGGTLQLVRSDGDTLLVRADGEVELGLDHP
jgi:hypothetical protein